MPKILITLVLLFATAVTGFFYLKPAWNEFKSLRKESDNLSNISAELDELIENRDDLVNSINTVSKEDLERVNRALPEGPRSADFLVLLEAIGKRHSVVLRRVDLIGTDAAEVPPAGGGQPRPGVSIPKAPQNTSGIQEFPFTLEITTTYETLKSFVNDLEHNLRIIDILAITFVPPGKPEPFNVSIKGKTYYQK